MKMDSLEGTEMTLQGNEEIEKLTTSKQISKEKQASQQKNETSHIQN